MALSRNQVTVLETLAANGGELSGMEIADIVGTLGRSSVYAALTALQRDGFIDARWDFSESHPRRMVKANKIGLSALSDLASKTEQRRVRARRAATNRGIV